jgi:hypothetical protein
MTWGPCIFSMPHSSFLLLRLVYTILPVIDKKNNNTVVRPTPANTRSVSVFYVVLITDEWFFCTIRSNRLRIYTPYLHACIRLTTGSREYRLLVAPFLRLVRRGERRRGEGE